MASGGERADDDGGRSGTATRILAGVGIGLAVSLALTACAVPGDRAQGAIASPSRRAPTGPGAAKPTWPRHPRVVGTIRALEPPQDNILLFKSILLHADRMACFNVTSIDNAIRVGARGTRHILVRCGNNRVRAVRLVFSGVAVPDLHPNADVGMNEPQGTLAMLGLRWHISWRSVLGRHRGVLLQQEPPPGTVVPLGTIVRVVYAR